jgi:hypothetical protein
VTLCVSVSLYTGRFIMFSVITNIYNKKTKVATFMELFTATVKVKIMFRCGAVQHCSRTGLLYSDPQRSSFIHL